MTELHDHELLADFARSGCETAFGELLRRHVNLVYSAALRFTSNPQQAEEISQAVFIILARKARSIRRATILSGWLYQTARLTAANFVRAEFRRQRREQEAYMQSTMNDSNPAAWEQIAPLLDEAMGGLGETDRAAIVLRYFENKTAGEIAAALNTTEAAAHKRVNRALDKLRRIFTKRGLTLSAVLITGAVSANSVHAAPPALAKTLGAVATAKGAAISGSTLTLIKGTLKLMAWTKAKTAIATGVIILLVAGTTTVAVKKFSTPKYDSYFTQMDSAKLWTVPPMVLVRPTHYAESGDQIIAADPGPISRLMRRDCPLVSILADAYGYGPERMILPDDFPTNRYDLLLTIPIHPVEALREELRKGFEFIGHTETRETDVLILRKANNDVIATRRPTTSRSHTISCDPGKLALVNYTMPEFADTLGGGYFEKPVIDETGMTNSYDISMHWEGNYDSGWTRNNDWNEQRQMFAGKLREQLGLEVVPARRSIDMLIIERTGHGASKEIMRKEAVLPALEQNSWKSVGYDSPAATFQTTMWAMKAGDLKAFMEGCTPDFQKRLMQDSSGGGKPRTDEQIIAGNRHNANEIASFEIIGNKVLSDEQEVLYVRAPKHGIGRVTMKKIDGEWKADGEPQ